MNDEQRVIDLIPARWFRDRGKSSVWVRCYWARPIVKPPFTSQFVIELARSILVFFEGSVTFSYADRPDIEPTLDRDARFRTPKRYGQATNGTPGPSREVTGTSAGRYSPSVPPIPGRLATVLPRRGGRRFGRIKA